MNDIRGLKAIPLNRLPKDAWEYLTGGDKGEMEKLSKQVAWLYGVQRKRANAIAGLPIYMTRGDDDVEKNDWPIRFNHKDIFKRYSLAMDLFGANYLFKQMRGNDVAGLRWLHPKTITPEINAREGLMAFSRRIGSNVDVYPVKDGRSDIIWTWLADTVEVGPGTPPADVVKTAANILRFMSLTTEGFFKDGAIDSWVLFSPEISRTSEEEKRNFFTWIKNVLRSGTKSQGGFWTLPPDARIEQINSPINEWTLPDLDQMEAQAICVAHDTPMMLMKPEQGSDKAMMEETRLMWVNETIIPHAELLVDSLNEHLFMDLGYEMVIRGEELNVNQEEENRKAQSYGIYVTAGMPPETAAVILGIDVPEGMPLEREFELPEPEPEPEQEVEPVRSVLWESDAKALKNYLKNRGPGTDVGGFNSNELSYIDKLDIYAEVFDEVDRVYP